MNMLPWVLIFLCFAGFSSQAPSSLTGLALKEDSEPLFLSKFIEDDKIEEGISLAKVPPFTWNGKILDVPSYSGLLTVNKTLGTHMFFWYFPAQNQPSKVPLIIWLNGYSTASTYGVFLQNGPYDLTTSASMVRRNTSWQQYYHVLYIDNPIGVGFSFTDSDEGYVKDFDVLANNLFSVLNQFYTLYPDLESHELYITGLSMGGKYVSTLAEKVYDTKLFNFKGIFLGDPLLDLKYQLHLGDYLLQLGFVSPKQSVQVKEVIDQAEELLKNKDYTTFFGLMGKFLLSENSYILNVTGLNNVYNYGFPYVDTTYYDQIINSDEIKRALHVGDMKFQNGDIAMNNAALIFSESVSPKLEKMIENVNMVFYAGQLDIVCAYPLLVNTLEALNWSGKSDYADADRIKLRDDNGTLYGYKRTYKTLTDILILKAGHSAVTDKPDNILTLLFELTNYDRFN